MNWDITTTRIDTAQLQAFARGATLRRYQNRREAKEGLFLDSHLKTNSSHLQNHAFLKRQNLSLLLLICILHMLYAQASTRLFASLHSFNTPCRVSAFRFEIPTNRPCSVPRVEHVLYHPIVQNVRPPPILIIMHERLCQYCRYQIVQAFLPQYTPLKSTQR